jgi:mannose-6-phosphate isomerase-like protein (cupin superfamily)
MTPSARPRCVDLAERLGHVDEHWSPKTVATFNGHEVKVVKVRGDFVWHTHESDELFLVVDGELTIAVRQDGAEHDVVLGPGQLYVVPRHVEHCPRSEHEVSLVLVDAEGVVNTGDAPAGALTAAHDDSLLDGGPA